MRSIADPNMGDLMQFRGTPPKLGWNRGWGQEQIITYALFRLVPNSMTLDDLEARTAETSLLQK